MIPPEPQNFPAICAAQDYTTRKDSFDDKRFTFKSAIMNIFKIAIDQMTMCNVKGVSGADKPTEIYNLTENSLNSAEGVGAFSGLQL